VVFGQKSGLVIELLAASLADIPALAQNQNNGFPPNAKILNPLVPVVVYALGRSFATGTTMFLDRRRDMNL